MRIQLTARTRAFTALGNEVLRDRRLSFTARGILAFLLSLPDGAREDVRTLADKNPGLGRRGVAKAVEELIALGYYVRHTVRDEHSGQVRTETYVFDTPQPTRPPLPAPAGTGRAVAGKTGTFPAGKKNPEEKPPAPAPATPPAGRTAEPVSTGGDTGRAVALLARIGEAEPRLALGMADVLALAPLAAPWLDRGLPEPAIRSLLTGGLPSPLHSPRALLADRLVCKLPAPRTRRDAAAPATPLAECTRCRDPLPRGHRTGVCRHCAAVRSRGRGGESAHEAAEATAVAPSRTAERVTALRAVLRSCGRS